MNYYDAADRLRVFNRQIGYGTVSDDQRPGERGVFEEYRYDALGRRIELRSRRGSGCTTTNNAECASVIERFVWDGDALVEELRASGKTTDNDFTLESDNASDGQSTGFALGQVGYVHAPGVLPMDEPVAILRAGMNGEPALVTIYPHASWRGGFIVGTNDLGQVATGTYSGPPIQWPAAAITVDGQIGNPSNIPSWMGSLLTGSSDGSGMQYRRNRYYDPQTGRFTQQDPAGLGGGMNLYGFAAGDPVNNSDPFGLCTFGKDCWKAFVDEVSSFWHSDAARASVMFAGMAFEDGAIDPSGSTADFEAQEATVAEKLPGIIYRRGTPSPSNLTVRDGEAALSFRSSVSNPVGEQGGRVLGKPGDQYFGIATARLPRGSVTVDNSPAGHVSVSGVSVEALKDAVVVRGKFPKP